MGGAGFEPAKAVPPDLQSGPFGRLGIHPVRVRLPPRQTAVCRQADPDRRLEAIPVACDRAGGESRTHNRRFTKPVLCRLSYASNQGREIA